MGGGQNIFQAYSIDQGMTCTIGFNFKIIIWLYDVILDLLEQAAGSVKKFNLKEK